MDTFYRIFASTDTAPDPETLHHRLCCDYGVAVTPCFARDPDGWFHADLTFPESGVVARLERYLATEEGIRRELNAWAAVLEAGADQPPAQLMERVIQTQQLFTLCSTATTDEDPDCIALCQALAGLTDGFYQVDGLGFFDANGQWLAHEG
jgi:hypothetical protein